MMSADTRSKVYLAANDSHALLAFMIIQLSRFKVTVKFSMIQHCTVEVPIIECPIPDDLLVTRVITTAGQTISLQHGSYHNFWQPLSLVLLRVVSSSGMLLTAFEMSPFF